MGQKLQAGDRVSIDGGEHAGKRGTIVPRLSIPFTHCRRGSIPQIDGAQEPLGIHDHLVRLDNGKSWRSIRIGSPSDTKRTTR